MLTLASSLCGLVAQHLESPLFGGTSGLVETVELMLKAESELAALRIQMVTVQNDPSADVEGLLKSVNSVCAAVRRAQVQLGAKEFAT
ncbi:hypothetical protein XI04_32800 [Bradyrhizobium sp. CCBAU 11430]|nr:hypothetical protein [Bradyrhizobium sp. CCBAU 21359]MDA9517788.1 hypothetical protein [Bradyrhizobium sp. CCBAU 11430]